ncbi:PREDICTED: UDP-glycosyltransferase 76E2-like [Nelumbo nucifera]|uniref:UDP-glucose iridoid glucosyltransferase-like n=2 Tax=Nelumbo nucifera TaxID=4432 RepID=A0A822ZEB5_NELNU|nr:PREDICTED: UDP-glycosyltransferase 76E2-like [Nelumbo nucifera]DAD42840.1 TPA_asm: hypothetical protein HUJ06_001070 [Nelumbo nucifera]
MENETKRRGHLVLVPCPLQGHLSPMLHLATLLHSRGFSITIVHTCFNSPNPSNYPPDFNFQPISDGLSDGEEVFNRGLVPFAMELNLNCETPFRDCMTRMLSDDLQNTVVFVIYDSAMYFVHTVANDLKVPTIVLRTSNATSFIAFTILMHKGCLQFEDNDQLDEPVAELPFLRSKDLPRLDTSSTGCTALLHEVMSHTINATKTASALIWNTFDHLESTTLQKVQHDLQVPVFPIGPLHKCSPSSCTSLLAEDRSCIGWLETQAPKSVIYISFGSIATISECELVEMAWGLAASEQHFLWVVRPGSVCGSKWVELLPPEFETKTSARGLVVKWAPQQQVLAHEAIGGFWTHGGWNSTLESICEGIPMLCQPCYGDQRVNARLVSHVWRVGMQLEDRLKREQIEKAIRRLMVGQEGLEMRERAMVLKEKVELSLKKGGLSYQSLEKLTDFLMSP